MLRAQSSGGRFMFPRQQAMLAIVISVVTGVSLAQQSHDRVIVGQERYIRTETQVSEGPRARVYENGVAIGDERVAYVYSASGPYGVSLHYRGFDKWGSALFGERDTGYVGSEYSIALVGDRIWILWYAGTANGGWFYQIMDSTTGQPLLPATSFRATGEAEGTGTSIRCATNGEILAVAVAAGASVYLYRFFGDGTPVGPPTTISALPNRWEGLPSIALLPDLSVVVGFGLGTYPWGTVPTLALVGPDGVLQRTVTVAQRDMWRMYVSALSDGTLLAAYQIQDDLLNPKVQKYSANLDPIGDPIPVEGHDRFFVAANGDGRFAVLLGNGTGDIWFRLYEPDGTPRNEGIPVQ
ncbi:MAG: hypothetical protein JNG88_17810, partial [Phycisphaerales bacterium]|nr:hypothetical protein [Phycisphaerales bacterium]